MGNDDYSVRPGGALKLKGNSGIHKKKKKPHKPLDPPTQKSTEPESTEPKHAEPVETDQHEPLESGRTEAERKFEEIRKLRLDSKLKQYASKSHRERIKEWNDKLEHESEHHDMPKIGPG